MYYVAIVQAEDSDTQLLPQRLLAQALQHPPAVLKAGVREVVVQVTDQGWQQVHERDMHRYGQLDAGRGPAEGQAAQIAARCWRMARIVCGVRAFQQRIVHVSIAVPRTGRAAIRSDILPMQDRLW